MRRLRSKIGPKVLIFKQASNENVELLPFEKPYPINFEMLTLERVRATFLSTALSFSLVHHKPKANALAYAFFFGSLFLFALAIEQKDYVTLGEE